MKIYVFDIDSTIADNSHRVEWLEREPKDWKRYNATMADDKPIADIIELLQSFDSPISRILLCTGRANQHRPVTEEWLKRHDIPYDALYMRAKGDLRPDSIVKVELLNEIRQDYGEPYLWFDDRDSVVEAIRAEGVRVLQVQPGDF